MSSTSRSSDIDIADVRRRVKEALDEAGHMDELVSSSATLTPNAKAVLKRRYQSKDREGNVIEEPDEMFRRVAHNLAQADSNYGATEQDIEETEEEFYLAMSSLEYLPNSPTMMNAGRELQMLSACFVLPVSDSMEEIFETVKQATLVQKSGGGTGFAFSRLRPEGDIVGSTGGVASGPVSFMRAFDGATEAVKQGSTRRGANMGILHVTHPDILRFISSKEDGTSISNFNISVAVTEEWMERVKAGEEYDLINPPHWRGHRPAQRPGGLRPAGADGLEDRGSGHSYSWTASTTIIPRPSWARSRAPTPVGSSPFCPTSPATWAA